MPTKNIRSAYDIAPYQYLYAGEETDGRGLYHEERYDSPQIHAETVAQLRHCLCLWDHLSLFFRPAVHMLARDRRDS